MAFLEDLKKLTNIEEFEYTYHKGIDSTMASAETLESSIPTTPEAYGYACTCVGGFVFGWGLAIKK